MTTTTTDSEKARRARIVAMVLFFCLAALMYVSIAYKIIKFGP
jgi:hypothetical protein